MPVMMNTNDRKGNCAAAIRVLSCNQPATRVESLQLRPADNDAKKRESRHNKAIVETFDD